MKTTTQKLDFTKFSIPINQHFEKMQKNDLYMVDCDSDELYAHYLASFPEGTNPMFRERTEHDCSCCRCFIKNMGKVVQIDGDKLVSIWDVDIKGPFGEVAKAMSEFIKSKPIKGVFSTIHSSFANETKEDREGTIHKWKHFFAKVNTKHVKTTGVAEFHGDNKTTFDMGMRGLTEVKMHALETILELIEEDSIYRGQEHKRSVDGFEKLQKQFNKAKNKEYFVWENIKNPVLRFRNTVIGQLALDIENFDLETAVKKFEAMVAPANYKRPKSLITKKMIADALKTVDKLNLRSAVDRRHAKITDVSVADVIFADSSVEPAMKDSLAELLEETVVPESVSLDNKIEIGIDEFLENIVPKANSISALVENKHLSNFVSITAPQDEAEQLFKWKSNFAWSYDGDVADSDIRAKVTERGGSVTGVLRFSHSWNKIGRNNSLMDLHVFMPGNQYSNTGKDCVDNAYGNTNRVGWNHRKNRSSGGTQDVDYVNPAPAGYVPVENITFPSLDSMPNGKYACVIHNWEKRGANKSGFQAEIEFDGQVFQYEHPEPLSHKQWVTVAILTLKDGKFSIEHKLEPSNTSKDKWGIKTQTLVPIDTIMLSPNYWNGDNTGNKHWFFILRDCKNPDKVRGFYNEFLDDRLNKHRKVFEVLGSKNRCEFSEDQLSGVGFSSTKRSNLSVVVRSDNSNLSYDIKF